MAGFNPDWQVAPDYAQIERTKAFYGQAAAPQAPGLYMRFIGKFEGPHGRRQCVPAVTVRIRNGKPLTPAGV